MIVPGTATVNASTGLVQLVAPMGFGTARGVRLSNFSATTLILTDISGVDQSQEYLAPQTQMVYPTVNVGAIPSVTSVSSLYSGAQVASNLLVEWSTEPDTDFIGTYPTALPVAISNTYGTVELLNLNSAITGPILNAQGLALLGQVPTGNAVLCLNCNTASAPLTFIVYEKDPTTGTFAQYIEVDRLDVSSGNTQNVTIPLVVQHTANLALAVVNQGTRAPIFNTNFINKLALYSLPNGTFPTVRPSYMVKLMNESQTSAVLTASTQVALALANSTDPFTSMCQDFDVFFYIIAPSATDTVEGYLAYNPYGGLSSSIGVHYIPLMTTGGMSFDGKGNYVGVLRTSLIGLSSPFIFQTTGVSNTTTAYKFSLVLIPRTYQNDLSFPYTPLHN